MLELLDVPTISDMAFYNYSLVINPPSVPETQAAPPLGINLDPVTASRLTVAKLSAIVALGCGSLILGLCPIILRRKSSGTSTAFKNFTSVLMYFGGGVLLATTFLHLLPEVTEQIEVLQQQGVMFAKEFPYAEVIMCAGFFMMFTIESIVHMFMIEPQSIPEGKNINVRAKNYMTCSDTVQETVDHHHHHHHHDHSHDHSHILRSASLRNFLIVMALSVHEVFEGLAVGLETVPAQVWYLLLAVACHKFVIALCLGLQITNNADGSNKLFVVNIIYVCIFSLCSPLGIAVGMLITVLTTLSADSVLLMSLSVILQGIATGTLMYIVFFEILKPHAHVSKTQTLCSLGFLLLGFVCMGLIQFTLAS